MKLTQHLFAGLLLCGWAIAALPVAGQAQDAADTSAAMTRADWERRAVPASRPSYQQVPPQRVVEAPPSNVPTGRRRIANSGVRQASYQTEADPLVSEQLPGKVLTRTTRAGLMSANAPIMPNSPPPQAVGAPSNSQSTAAPTEEVYSPNGLPVVQGQVYGDGTIEGPMPAGPGCGCGCPGGGAIYEGDCCGGRLGCGLGMRGLLAGGCGLGSGCGLGGCGIGGCAVDDCGCCGGDERINDFSVFAGLHAFKSPLELGRSANFGVHEGFMLGGPLGGLMMSEGLNEIGWEIGIQGVHSDFAADPVVGRANRDQFFGTVGIFRRPECCGFQWGVAMDYMHDDFFPVADFTQIRGELGAPIGECSEFGVTGSFTTDRRNRLMPAGDLVTFRSLDQYKAFWRLSLQAGSEIETYAGLTGLADGILGGAVRLPVTNSLVVENAVQYMIPGFGGGVQNRESWNLVMNLVWYPGHSAQCAMQSPYRPLFPVADNSTFLIETR